MAFLVTHRPQLLTSQNDRRRALRATGVYITVSGKANPDLVLDLVEALDLTASLQGTEGLVKGHRGDVISTILGKLSSSYKYGNSERGKRKRTIKET